MAIGSSDIIALMREQGIAPDLLDGIDPALPLVQQGFDSIDIPSIAVAVEKRYGVDLSDANVAVLRSLDEFVGFVNQHAD